MGVQISELVSYYINDISNTLDVSFRIFDDEEEHIRIDEISLSEVETFGYKLKDKIDVDLFDDYDDDEEEENGVFQRYEEEMSYSEIKTFLNQYYLIYPDYLPNSELF